MMYRYISFEAARDSDVAPKIALYVEVIELEANLTKEYKIGEYVSGGSYIMITHSDTGISVYEGIGDLAPELQTPKKILDIQF